MTFCIYHHRFGFGTAYRRHSYGYWVCFDNYVFRLPICGSELIFCYQEFTS